MTGERYPLRSNRDSKQHNDCSDDDPGDLQPTEDVALPDPERVCECRDSGADRPRHDENDPHRSWIQHVHAVPSVFGF
jgi:hypothetical protein